MNDQRTVLLLEDDANLGLILQEHLKLNGYEVTLCANGVEGSEALEAGSFDLCLVDVMMPKKDGFTFAREVRASNNQIPLIFLTAKSLKDDRIEGFRIGCDDYITKPFSVEELQLRIEAVLRRSLPDSAKETPTQFEIGQYRFDSIRQLLEHQDETRTLTARESELLAMLCLHMNKVLEKEHALKEIWGDSSYFSGRSMDVFVSKLRKYLKHDSSVSIMSIHGRGLRLVVG
jgi:two-component system OmpR family response regulator